MTEVLVTALGASPAAEPMLQTITSNEDVVRSRQLARALAQQCGLSLVDQTKLVTAASELARNTLIHGGGGRLHAALLERGGRRGVELRFSDEGPGIADLELAMTDGWTSGGGLGLGLSGAKRLVDEFRVDSEAGRGTTVSVVKWTR